MAFHHILSTSQLAIFSAADLLRATLNISFTDVSEYLLFHPATKSRLNLAVLQDKAACISRFKVRRDSFN